MSVNTTMWDVANTKINVCSSMLQYTVKIYIREIHVLKDTKKTCNTGESFKYKLKCEFRHDEKTDSKVSNQISELKKSINKLLEQNAKNEERILCLEQNVREIKDGKQQMYDGNKNLSAELDKLKTMCEGSKSLQPPKSALNDDRLIQNNSNKVKSEVCELSFKDKEELK